MRRAPGPHRKTTPAEKTSGRPPNTTFFLPTRPPTAITRALVLAATAEQTTQLGRTLPSDPAKLSSHLLPKMMRTSTASLLRSAALVRAAARPASMATRAASTHAISNPTLSNIEKRWEGMPLQEQAELWMALRDRMKENWAELTVQEKKAAYWIAFGPHGPRSLPPPDEGKKVAFYTFLGVVASFVIFASMRAFAGPAPHTMNKEWQEAANEKLKAENSEPITGISSEGYKGKGQVQSPSGRP
ncbi:COX4-domain-containing protein [Thozetella sp. PMI_491]|nr:COX4-domain-containing protein [Thozetella sp. PMI_491]